MLKGEVHDENAYLLDGVSGHAGVFSNAYDLAKYAQLFLNEGTWLGTRILSDNTILNFISRQEIPQGSDRALGWDTPSRNGKSSAGDYFSDQSYGHLGFTGTSLWLDHDRDIIVVLLTNRVHPSRENSGMYSIRRQFHTEVMKAICKILDLLIIIIFFLFFIGIGFYFSQSNLNSKDYYTASGSMPWPVAMFSIVATETSVLTFISIPSLSYRSDWWFLQLAIGYIIGRVLVSAFCSQNIFQIILFRYMKL